MLLAPPASPGGQASPVRGTVSIPGSKSASNRALILASLSATPTELRRLSPSDDTRLLLGALEQLGVQGEFLDDAGETVRITPPALLQADGVIHVGAAGTALRFLTALLAGSPGCHCTLTGDTRLCERPVGALVAALRHMGGQLRYSRREGSPPLVIAGQKLRGGPVALSTDESSQYTSALLLSASLLDETLELQLTGRQTSESYVHWTRDVMAQFGIAVEATDQGWRVPCKRPAAAGPVELEMDATGALYFLGLAAITGGEVTVQGMREGSPQGDWQMLEFLSAMGCDVRQDGGTLTVGGPQRLQAVTADLSDCPDSAQTLAVLAACAEGTSELRGLHTLPLKETDRLAALQQELGRCGIAARIQGGDTLIVVGGEPRGVRVATYGDHRMAMAFALLGARYHGVAIENPEVVSKSFPGFWERLVRLGVECHAG